MASQYHSYIITILCCLTIIGDIAGQSVYPGDSNLDSIANNIDVLYLGKAYGQTGAPRNSISIDWEALDAPVPPWATTIYGIPAHYSDCDGNGMVSDSDIEAIQFNYGSQYGEYIPVGEGSGPILRIEAVEDTVGMGEEMIYRIVMGSDTETFENVEGIAYTIRMGSTFNQYEVDLEFSDINNWFVDPTEQLHLLQIEPLFEMDVANTRIDQTGQTGFGEVARLSYYIDKDLIGGLTEPHTPFELSVTNIIVSYSDYIDTLKGSADTIYIHNPNATTSFYHPYPEENINITPNPFSSHLSIAYDGEPIEDIKVMDTSGRVVYQKNTDATSDAVRIQTDSWPQGIYILHCRSQNAHYNQILVKH